MPSFTILLTQVGDRVLVGGAKTGLLKYVGRTDFAKGIWAGIELDEAIGKNDGAVAGKRYVYMCRVDSEGFGGTSSLLFRLYLCMHGSVPTGAHKAFSTCKLLVPVIQQATLHFFEAHCTNCYEW